MPRYLVERTFPGGLAIPMTEEGAATCRTVVGNNAEDLVTWVQSYVTQDKNKTSVFTTARRRKPSGRPPAGTDCPWIGSSK